MLAIIQIPINEAAGHYSIVVGAPRRAQHLAGGNPAWEGVAAPPIANLGHGMATCRVKRRKSGDRVIRQFSPEITDN